MKERDTSYSDGYKEGLRVGAVLAEAEATAAKESFTLDQLHAVLNSTACKVNDSFTNVRNTISNLQNRVDALEKEISFLKSVIERVFCERR